MKNSKCMTCIFSSFYDLNIIFHKEKSSWVDQRTFSTSLINSNYNTKAAVSSFYTALHFVDAFEEKLLMRQWEKKKDVGG